MPYGFIQDVPADRKMYEQIKALLPTEPPTGMVAHLVLEREGGLRYIDVWESEDACARAFDERIHPAVDIAFGGQRPSGEPEVHRLDVLHADGALLDTSWS